MQVVSFSPVQIDESRKANVRVPHVLHPSCIMTDAKQGDDDQRKIGSSSLHKKHLPSHHLHLAFPLVLETLASPAKPEVHLLAPNCWPGCHSHVVQLQPLLHGPILLRKEGRRKFSANIFISRISNRSDGSH
jgi:hypothetical protein